VAPAGACIVQSFPQDPQLCASVSTSVHVPAHAVSAPHEHEPHVQVAATHVCVPLPMHGWVSLPAHAPSPLQADHIDHGPPVQVRV
jgi:hypothetical protein